MTQTIVGEKVSWVTMGLIIVLTPLNTGVGECQSTLCNRSARLRIHTEVIRHVCQTDGQVACRAGCPLIIELISIATLDLEARLVGDVEASTADEDVEFVFHTVVPVDERHCIRIGCS